MDEPNYQLSDENGNLVGTIGVDAEGNPVVEHANGSGQVTVTEDGLRTPSAEVTGSLSAGEVNRTVYAEPGDNLQQKIDEAEGGGKLVLESGTYQMPAGGYEIGSDIIIEGRGNPTLEGDTSHTGLETNYLITKNNPNIEENIILRGFTIDTTFDVNTYDWDSEQPQDWAHAISLSAHNLLIDNVTVRNGTRDCMDLAQVTDTLVMNSTFDTAFTDDVIEVSDDDEMITVPSGESAEVTDNLYFYKCTIKGSGAGKERAFCNGLEFENAPKPGGKAVAIGCSFEDNHGGDIDIQDTGDVAWGPGTVKFSDCRFGSTQGADWSSTANGEAEEIVFDECDFDEGFRAAITGSTDRDAYENIAKGTWNGTASSREVGTWYENTGSDDLEVTISLRFEETNSEHDARIDVNSAQTGNSFMQVRTETAGFFEMHPLTFTVPPSHYYRVRQQTGIIDIQEWYER